MFYSYIPTPIGRLCVVASEEGLVNIDFENDPNPYPLTSSDIYDPIKLSDVAEQFKLCFKKELTSFRLPLSPSGTDFQKTVWQELQNIPYGEVISYKTLAQRIGNIKAVRAVGNANGKNPLPIVVPCHRVIGSNGTLTGFAGGLEIKQRLLDLESNHLFS